jgi:hypothetical protein
MGDLSQAGRYGKPALYQVRFDRFVEEPATEPQ